MRVRRGSILILSLFALALLGLLSVSLAYRASIESRITSMRASRAELSNRAASIAVMAMVQLRADTNSFDHAGEAWANFSADTLADASAGSPAADVTRIWAHCRVVDEEGKLHVAYASGEHLERLGMTEQQIAALFDWMDSDEDPRPDGAESDYYLTSGSGHRAKNAQIELMEELALVRWFSAADYRSAWERQAAPADLRSAGPSGDGEASPGWSQLLTCIGDGKININTAPGAVLSSLPLSPDAADQILAFRAFDVNSRDTLEDHAFQSVKDIDQLQGLTDADKEYLRHRAVFSSNHFRIVVRAAHRASGAAVRLEVLVRRGQNGLEVLQWIAN